MTGAKGGAIDPHDSSTWYEPDLFVLGLSFRGRMTRAQRDEAKPHLDALVKICEGAKIEWQAHHGHVPRKGSPAEGEVEHMWEDYIGEGDR